MNTAHRPSAIAPLVMLLVGCTIVAPSSPPDPSRAATSSPPAISPRGSPAVETLSAARGGTIDQQFTTPVLEYRSTGSMLIWSSAARADRDSDTAPDLFASEPGGPVSLIYDNPNRDSRLELIGGDGDRVVFVEDNGRVFGPGRWKLWYLADPQAKALLVDEGSGNLPFFDLSGSRLVWALNGNDAAQSELWLLDLMSMERRLLESGAAAAAQYWFPAIDGDLVVYGTVELTSDGREERHVYLLGIDGEPTPRRLDTGNSATMGASEPDIRGEAVVWKESSLAEGYVGGGSLVSHSLESGKSEQLILDPNRPRYIDPSIGDRYVAAWSDYDRALYLADLETGVPLEILDLGTTNLDDHENVGQIAHLNGDLLAYIFGPANNRDLELRWIILV